MAGLREELVQGPQAQRLTELGVKGDHQTVVALHAFRYGAVMTTSLLDEYLAATPEPQRKALQTVREHIHAVFPDIEECSAYGVPAFALDGLVLAGIARRKNGCSYYPMSGSLLDGIDVAALGYTRTKGALQFPADTPLSLELVRQLLHTRLAMG